MAQRRMFSKKITDTDMFLDMPMSAQCLYFHLNMDADDDGFLGNAKTIKRKIGASDDDLKLLIAKQFIIPFENGVVVIKDWKIHNFIRKDTYNPTVYGEEKKRLVTDDNGSYSFDQTNVNVPLTTSIRSVDGSSPQVRLGKDRLGKDKDILSDSKESDHIPYKEIIEYLNEKAEKHFRNIESNKKLIRARWNDGYKLDDFKKVIDIKTDEWLKTDMSKYLQPSTLFSPKFDQYLNQQVKQRRNDYGSNEYDDLF